MNRDTVIDLLTIISATDNRNIDEADITLWLATIGGLDEADAIEAIEGHIRDCPGVWMEPGHVIARCRAIRRERLDRMDPDERPVAPGTRTDRYGKIDKSAPDEEPYPAEWTSDQRVRAHWAKIQSYRDEQEYEQAVAHPGSLLIEAPASAKTRAQAIAAFTNSQLSFEDVGGADVPHVNALLVACPFCRAALGEHCTKAGMPGQEREKLVSTPGHPGRIEAAAREAGYPEPVVAQIVATAARRHVASQRSQWKERDKAPTPIPPKSPEAAEAKP